MGSGHGENAQKVGKGKTVASETWRRVFDACWMISSTASSRRASGKNSAGRSTRWSTLPACADVTASPTAGETGEDDRHAAHLERAGVSLSSVSMAHGLLTPAG